MRDASQGYIFTFDQKLKVDFETWWCSKIMEEVAVLIESHTTYHGEGFTKCNPVSKSKGYKQKTQSLTTCELLRVPKHFTMYTMICTLSPCNWKKNPPAPYTPQSYPNKYPETYHISVTQMISGRWFPIICRVKKTDRATVSNCVSTNAGLYVKSA